MDDGIADLRQRDPSALALLDGGHPPLTASELEQRVGAVGAEGLNRSKNDDK